MQFKIKWWQVLLGAFVCATVSTAGKRVLVTQGMIEWVADAVSLGMAILLIGIPFVHYVQTKSRK
ncbi:MAG: hypothetical protein H7Y17_05975 [Chlorobia bacterium]|nr:hypothetical protein [Fimbriimonadaceae bacterium]